MNEEIKKIKEENKILNDRLNKLETIPNHHKNDNIEKINELKDTNNISITPSEQKILSNDSTIMEKDEVEMIKSAIKERMNKDIKLMKKIYQATIDGGDSDIFHKKCNNIPNTLVLYKSAGNRRFGGFVSECWKSDNKVIQDKNCFLFSLDKRKIYPPKNNNYYQISYYEEDGPSFCLKQIYCVKIEGNAIKNKSLKTFENGQNEIFSENNNALSEDGNFLGVYAKEYEVFQVIF